jgi:hypothetical protein
MVKHALNMKPKDVMLLLDIHMFHIIINTSVRICELKAKLWPLDVGPSNVVW